jgi:predicted nucleic acid-binding protein
MIQTYSLLSYDTDLLTFELWQWQFSFLHIQPLAFNNWRRQGQQKASGLSLVNLNFILLKWNNTENQNRYLIKLQRYRLTYSWVVIQTYLLLSYDTDLLTLELWYRLTYSWVMILTYLLLSYDTDLLTLELWYWLTHSWLILLFFIDKPYLHPKVSKSVS